MNNLKEELSKKNTTSWLELFPFKTTILFLWAIFLTFSVFYVFYFNSFSANFSARIFLGNLNGILLVLLSALYFLASKFYQNKIYTLIAIGWGFIAVQSYLYSFIDLVVDENFWVLNLGFSIITTLPFYFAGRLLTKRNLEPSRILFGLSLWLVQIILTNYIFYYYGYGILFINFGNSFLYISYCSQIPFTIWALILVGKGISGEFSIEQTKYVKQLSQSFYLYAFLQLLYFFIVLGEEFAFVNLIFFNLGVIIKVINGLLLVKILSSEFDKLTKQKVKQNVFEDIGRLTASIEHELRNPLIVLQTDLRIILTKFQHNEALLPFIFRLQTQANRIFEASQIITYLRNDPDSISKFMEKENIEITIRRTIDFLKRSVDTTNIYIKVNKSGNVNARIYSSMFSQALLNILKNSVEAIKQAKRKSGQINIDILNDFPEKQFFSININDNGCGIPKENIEKITTIFSTKQNHKLNSGIGLFVSERIIKVHSGKLKITSKLGEGTTVCIVLPKWNNTDYAEKNIIENA